MKRTVCSLLTAAAMVGCQATGPHGPQRVSYPPAGVGPSAMHPSATPSAAPSMAATAAPQSDVMQVGYNTGHGKMNNLHFGRQRVAAALPSHGGMAPGMGMGMPGMGPGMGGMGPGMGMGGMPGVPLGPRFTTGRTQIRFAGPLNMAVAWQTADPTGANVTFTDPQLTTPDRYNFLQAQIYRLKLSKIPGRDGVELYPTIEVYPGNAKVDAYLAHNSVPVEFTDEDFDQVAGGNYVTKVIYLPDAKYQELAIAGVETLVSTRLDPGVDPVAEANRRGSILCVVRMGSVDLEMTHSPALLPTGAPLPPGAMMGGMGMMPPGAAAGAKPMSTVPTGK